MPLQQGLLYVSQQLKEQGCPERKSDQTLVAFR